MSDDKKPRLEIKFANGTTVPVKIIDIGMDLIDDGLCDEVSVEFGPNGEVSTMRDGEFSCEMLLEPAPGVVEAIREHAKRAAEQN